MTVQIEENKFMDNNIQSVSWKIDATEMILVTIS